MDKPLAVFRCAAAHAVKGHRDEWRSGGVGSGGVGGNVLPKDRTVFAIVGDGPDTGYCLDESLIAVVVKLRSEVVNGGVLIELIGGVDGISPTFRRCFSVVDVVEIIGIAIARVNRSNSVCKFATIVVAIGDSIGLFEDSSIDKWHIARLLHSTFKVKNEYASTCYDHNCIFFTWINIEQALN